MIVIRIELWPMGDPSKARELGRGTIANVGGSALEGNYRVKLFKSAEYAAGENVGKVIGDRQ